MWTSWWTSSPSGSRRTPQTHYEQDICNTTQDIAQAALKADKGEEKALIMKKVTAVCKVAQTAGEDIDLAIPAAWDVLADEPELAAVAGLSKLKRKVREELKERGPLKKPGRGAAAAVAAD